MSSNDNNNNNNNNNYINNNKLEIISESVNRPDELGINLFSNKYLIPVKLHERLFQANDYEFNFKSEREPVKISKNPEGISLVAFRILNRSEKSLVYNYVHFDKDFYLSFVVYLIFKDYNKHIRSFKEWGSNLVCFDSNIINYGMLDDFVSPASLNHGTNTRWLYERVHELVWALGRNEYDIRLSTITEFMTKLTYVNNYQGLANVIDLCFKSDNIGLYNTFFGTLDSKSVVDDSSLISFNLLNRTLFLVENVSQLTLSLTELGYNVNQGPQTYRGQINSMSSLLSSVDIDYRESLFAHYNYNKKKGKIALQTHFVTLHKNHFSFRNVHMNLGNVRWFSTSRKLSEAKYKNRQELFDSNYNIISQILDVKNNSDNVTTQKAIEDALHKQEVAFMNSNSAKSIIKFNNEKAYTQIFEKKKKIISLLKGGSDMLVLQTRTRLASDEYLPWVKKILDTIGVDNMASLLLEYFVTILTKETVNIDDVETPGIPSLFAYNQFGKKVINRYRYIKYTDFVSKTKYTGTLNQYINLHYAEFSATYEENFPTKVCGYYLWALCSVELLEEVIDKHYSENRKSMYYLRIRSDIRSIFIKDNVKIFHIPTRLPMICPPKDFVYSKDVSENRLGGFLLNDVRYTDYIFKDKVGYGHKTVLKDDNIIVDMVNGMAKTPFKVNEETLGFIYKYGISKKILTDLDNSDTKSFINNPYKKYLKQKDKDLRSKVSNILLEKNILSIATIYSKQQKIYFPVRLDVRTRLYCETDSFNYQGSDLAKGLISFAEPGVINKYDDLAIKFFKAFGANMFGASMDKKSINYRVNWVDVNSDRILNFEHNSIVDEAESKACFVSFCFEYNRFINFMNDHNLVKFPTYLPIQLDASCSCYQHLALLTKESRILNKLNLDASSHDDAPDDFYSYILSKTHSYISSLIEKYSSAKPKTLEIVQKLDSLLKLSKVMFGRSIIKMVIMTGSYNASIPKQVDIILKELESFKYDESCNCRYYKYKDFDVELTNHDVVQFVMLLKVVIAKESPRIAELSRYIDGIVHICTKLNIPIPWTLPHGAEISESYLAEMKEKIRAFSFVKSKYTFKNYDKTKYDLKQQKRATMPNIIHSLDATTISLLYHDFKVVGPIYTVHDCFAVSAGNVPKLVSMLKVVYLKMYSAGDYLSEFDKLVRVNIISQCGSTTFDETGEYVNLPMKSGKKKKVAFPDVNKILNLDVNNSIENLANSSYIIV